MNRPYTTLFMLMSVDGKISTGDVDTLDVDQDYKHIPGLAEGLPQYYALERETDAFSLNTGRVFAKIGVNDQTKEPEKLPVSFIVIDSQPHLTEQGVSYLAKKSQKLIVVTTHASHPAYAAKVRHENVEIIFCAGSIDFAEVFTTLAQKHGVERITVQSGGTLNATLVRSGLIDRALLVVAPALIGGAHTASLMDGESLHEAKELQHIKTLELVRAKPLNNSYLLLEYTVRN